MNLLSTGNIFTEIDLASHNTTLIVGENGAGKSTILDALSFGLFGKPFRKVNKGQLINSINNKGLLVEVEFQIGNKFYIVKRGAKPNVFEIVLDGVPLSHDASSVDYQEMLEKHILKINHKTFSQIVVLGSASFVPFMQMASSPRKQVIEDLLELQVFTTMNTLLKEKISANKTQSMENIFLISGNEDKIELENQHLEELKKNNQEIIEQLNNNKATLQGEIDEANDCVQSQQASIAELSNSIVDQDKVRTRLEKVVSLTRQLNTKYEKILRETEFFNSNHDCPTCRQGIADDHRNQIVDTSNQQLREIEQAKQTIKGEHDRLTARLEEIADINGVITTRNRIVSDLLVQIQMKTGFISSIEKEVERLKANKQINANETRLTELLSALKKLSQQSEQISREKATLEIAGILLKDSGIKTKIIRQYVPLINKLINKYLASMDFFVNFELNENFEEKIKSRFRDEFSYDSFSEGEKARIDLALLFTWRAISRLRNSASTNLLILDEVFDGSLDAQGNDELLKIIQTLTEGNNVCVISHKTDAFIDKFERVLKFEKIKNFSRMIQL